VLKSLCACTVCVCAIVLSIFVPLYCKDEDWDTVKQLCGGVLKYSKYVYRCTVCCCARVSLCACVLLHQDGKMEEQLIQPMMFWATTSVDDPNEVRSGAGSYIAAVLEVLTGAQESIDLIYEGAAAIPRACACVQCTRFVHGGTRFVHGGCVSCLAGCGRGCESRESWRMLRDRTARRGVACGATWLRVDASARDAVHDAGCPALCFVSFAGPASPASTSSGHMCACAPFPADTPAPSRSARPSLSFVCCY